MRSGSLQDDTKCENAACRNERQSTTNSVGDGSCSKSTKECPGRKDGDDFGGLRGCNIQVAFGISVARRKLVFPIAMKGEQSCIGDPEELTTYPIARMPLIVPVSYPNKTPPKATNIPMTMAGHDRPGTPSGFCVQDL